MVERRGGTVLTHDGGAEDSPSLLPGLVARAAVVLFAVDCFSHDAAGSIKRACRDRAILFVPLRAAGLAALLRALETVAAHKRDAAAARPI